ncbi:MAG: carbohydrate kinase [Bacteroidales bacterium]|nr:carbohydrate kinase [Bacteroidales bacterium]
MTERESKYQMAGIGELLWDILPDGRKLGGSPMNVAYHCQAAGIKSAVVSAIGNDKLGSEILEQVQEKEITRDFIQIYDNSPTGTVSVKLNQGIPDFTIHPDVAWDEIQWNKKLEELARSIDAVAFGSLSQRNSVSRQTIQNFLKSMKPDSLRVFDINLRQQFHSKELLKETLELSNILKINNEELPVLAKYLNLKGTVNEQLHALINCYSLKLVAYTMGSEGSWLLSKDSFSDMQAPKVKIADTVGAGDAFTGVLIAGLLKGKPMKIIHQEASSVAGWVCSKAGAMPGYRT